MFMEHKRRLARLAPLALFLGGLAMAPQTALATCGSATCYLVTGHGEGVLAPHQGVMDLSYRYIPQDRMLSGGRSVSEVYVPAVDFAGRTLILDHHRELRTINMLAQVDLSYGITPALTLAVSVPFYNRRLHEHFDDVDLSVPDPGTFTSADGSDGFGDVAVTARYAVHGGDRHLVVAGVGVKTPTGEYKLRNHLGEINEPTVMPGSGSWDGLFSLYGSYRIVPDAVTGFVSASHRVNRANPLDYRRGDVTTLSAGAWGEVTEGITLSGQVNAVRQGRDHYAPWGDVPNTGSTTVFVTPGVRLATGQETSVYSHLQLPVREHVNESNLAPRYALELGMTHAF